MKFITGRFNVYVTQKRNIETIRVHLIMDHTVYAQHSNIPILYIIDTHQSNAPPYYIIDVQTGQEQFKMEPLISSNK